MATGLVDVHTHFMPRALAEALERRGGFPRVERSRESAYIHYGPASGHPLLPEMERLDLRLADMDRQGIVTAILCVNVPGVDAFAPAEGAAVARAANDELVEVVRARNGRIAALAVLPAQAPEEAAAELERAVAAGLCGASMFSNLGGTPLDAPGWRSSSTPRPRSTSPCCCIRLTRSRRRRSTPTRSSRRSASSSIRRRRRCAWFSAASSSATPASSLWSRTPRASSRGS